MQCKNQKAKLDGHERRFLVFLMVQQAASHSLIHQQAQRVIDVLTLSGKLGGKSSDVPDSEIYTNLNHPF